MRKREQYEVNVKHAMLTGVVANGFLKSSHREKAIRSLTENPYDEKRPMDAKQKAQAEGLAAYRAQELAQIQALTEEQITKKHPIEQAYIRNKLRQHEDANTKKGDSIQ